MSLIIGQIRRRLSTAFIRAVSLCTLNRISNVGPGSLSAAKRREWAIREENLMKNERRAHWNAFIENPSISHGGIHFFGG